MRRRLDAVCGTCAAGVSVVCMSSMATAAAAAGTAFGAGAAGMGGMGGGAAASGAFSALPGLVEGLGLGFLNRLPNEVLQPFLVVLLTLSVGSAYLAYRWHGRPQALVLAAASALAMYAAMYAAIYVSMSDPLTSPASSACSPRAPGASSSRAARWGGARDSRVWAGV